AIVTVADDGGSSGRLREEMDMLPPGDIRNVLTALADTEPLMEKVMQYRFSTGTGLAGHNLGNLLLAAMNEITGDFV
ncbi:YvcK family protein, partial [Anoxybacillus sp. LAT_38]|nr:YvcK family protein [Anoxybacillus sp. LAT_38]